MNSTCPAIDYQTNKDRTLEKNLKGEGGPYLPTLTKIRLKRLIATTKPTAKNNLILIWGVVLLLVKKSQIQEEDGGVHN